MALPNVPDPMSDADFDVLIAGLIQARDRINAAHFTVTLSDSQVRELSPVADKMQGFVEKTHQGTKDFAGDLPASYEHDDFDRTYKTWKQSQQIETLLSQMIVGPHNTSMLASSAAKGFADIAYGIFDMVARFNSNIKGLFEELSRYYEKRGNRHDKPVPPTS